MSDSEQAEADKVALAFDAGVAAGRRQAALEIADHAIGQYAGTPNRVEESPERPAPLTTFLNEGPLFKVRALHILRSEGVFTLLDLYEYMRTHDLREVRNVNEHTLETLREGIISLGHDPGVFGL